MCAETYLGSATDAAALACPVAAAQQSVGIGSARATALMTATLAAIT